MTKQNNTEAVVTTQPDPCPEIAAAGWDKQKPVRLFWYDGLMLAWPMPEELQEALTITEKSLECNRETRFVRKTVFRKRKLYELQKRGEKIVGVIFPGFLHTAIRALCKHGYKYVLRDMRIMRKGVCAPEPRLDLMYGFRFSQRELLTQALRQDISGLIGAPTRYGKCLCKGERCMMYDYSYKAVEDIRKGDKLMGPDGKPRKVLALGHGTAPCHRIVPRFGEPFCCNGDHILVLRRNKGGTIEISVDAYLASNDPEKKTWKLWYATLDDIPQTAEDVLSMDYELAGRTHGRFYSAYGLPLKVMRGPKRQRAALLRGLMNSIGVIKGSGAVVLERVCKQLAYDIMRLSRSLGFRCKASSRSKKEGCCWKAVVETSKANSDVSPFKVDPVGEQEYFGFELDGDGRFLMWDHLVSHNTTLMVNTLRAFPTLTAVVTAPGVDLVKQLYADLTGERGITGREIRLIGSGSTRKPTETGINVCSVDSLHKIDPGSVRLLLADEPHALVTNDRLQNIDAFRYCRRYGYGATLQGRFDNRDLLITGLFGPVLAERTYKEAVAEGAICPLEIIFMRVKLDPDNYYKDRDAAYNELFFCNDNMAALTSRICHEIIPDNFQTLVFIRHEKQADLYMEHIGEESTIAMAKRLKASERAEVDRLMKANVIKRCLCSRIYVQGVTFSDVRVLINCEAGGNNTSAIQKPGRLAEIRPGKKCGIIIDFLFEPAYGSANEYRGESWMALCNDSANRKKAYEEKGYGITLVDSLEALKDKFDTLI